MAEYDEDLNSNAVFMALLSSHALHMADPQAHVFVPRADSFVKDQLTAKDIATHILHTAKATASPPPVPVQEEVEAATHDMELTDFTTRLQNEYITVVAKGKELHVLDANGNTERVATVLFDETFYTPDDKPFTVNCIDKPLTGAIATVEPTSVLLTSYQECRRLLAEIPGRKFAPKIEQHLASCSAGIAAANDLPHALAQVHHTYNQLVKLVPKDAALKKYMKVSTSNTANVYLALETVLAHRLVDGLFPHFVQHYANQDTVLNAIARGLSIVQPERFGLDPSLVQSALDAAKLAATMSDAQSPMEKMQILTIAMQTLFASSSSSKPLSADELLPALCTVIIRAGFSHWHATLSFVQELALSNTMTAQDKYYLTSLEAAVHHVMDMNPADPSYFEWQPSAGDESIEPLFRAVWADQLEDVQQFLAFAQDNTSTTPTAKAKSADDSIHNGERNTTLTRASSCHPLCTCYRCKPVGDAATLHDKFGRTPLHIAALLGRNSILEFLLSRSSTAEVFDENMDAPLHLACARNQETSVLLLLEKCSVNVTDRSSNTPLHICADRGHLRSAKALLLEGKPRINARNCHGDTPLHIAARWGYTSMVRLLLQFAADVRTINNRRETPLDISYSKAIADILQGQHVPQTVPMNFTKASQHSAARKSASLPSRSMEDIREGARFASTKDAIPSDKSQAGDASNELASNTARQGSRMVRSRSPLSHPRALSAFHRHAALFDDDDTDGSGVGDADPHQVEDDELSNDEAKVDDTCAGHHQGDQGEGRDLTAPGGRVDVSHSSAKERLGHGSHSEQHHDDGVQRRAQPGRSQTPRQRMTKSMSLPVEHPHHQEQRYQGPDDFFSGDDEEDTEDHDNLTALHSSRKGNKPLSRTNSMHASYENLLDDEKQRYLDLVFEAIEEGEVDLVKYRLNLDPDAPNPYFQDRCHPLCQCERCSRMVRASPVVSLNINSQNTNGFTPLLVAVRYGQVEVVRMLLAHGADVSRAVKQGLCSLHFACQYDHREIVKLLLAANVDVDSRDKYGTTPLHLAASNGHTECARLLLNAGAAINAVDSKGNTPLHRACRWGHAELVLTLLKFGSDPAIRNVDGKTSAEECRNDRIRQIILHVEEHTCPSHMMLRNAPAELKPLEGPYDKVGQLVDEEVLKSDVLTDSEPLSFPVFKRRRVLHEQDDNLPSKDDIFLYFDSKTKCWSISSQLGSADVLLLNKEAVRHPGLLSQPWLLPRRKQATEDEQLQDAIVCDQLVLAPCDPPSWKQAEEASS
eukprot:m.117643 g.117643  ORF g.117643 m.117643 type:complete len:1268 (+) comp15434_c3_seq3:95-3898(+)